MNFKGTIIITDPCYFAKDEDWGEVFDYDDLIIESPEFSSYIWNSTGYGDGSWGIYGLDKVMSSLELEEHIKKVHESLEENRRVSSDVISIETQKLLKPETPLGTFGVDSGTFGVFLLDEVLKYNPSFLADVGEWCYTIIPDFIGSVEVIETVFGDEDTEFELFKLLGVGNKTFYSR